MEKKVAVQEVARRATSVLVGLGVFMGMSLAGCSGSSAPATGPEGVAMINAPDLATASTTAPGTPVDGITCRTESAAVVKWHHHVHLAIYVDGHERRIPAGVGITPPRIVEHLSSGVFLDVGPKDCLYWLHDHTDDGIIHMESPYPATFVLGQFFDIWRQPLSPDRVGPASGRVTAFVNGKKFIGDPRSIPLRPHAVIQLDVGAPVVPFHNVHFTVSGGCGSGSTSCSARL